MIAPLMLYAIVVGTGLAAAGAMLERSAAALRWPRRWIWAAVLAVNVGLPLVAPWRAEPRTDLSERSLATSDSGRGSLAGAVQTDVDHSPGWRDRLRAAVDRAARVVARFEVVGRWIWASGSLAVMVLFIDGRRTFARRRRRWGEARVDGVPVLISMNDGPALVGIWSPRIVIPQWAFALDPPAVELMIRHEREHRRAGDPWLLHGMGIVILLMPWNLVTWWMVSRLRLAIEMDCDARVLGLSRGRRDATDADATAYGELLLAVAARRSPRQAFIVPAMLERSSTLGRRIAAMCTDRGEFLRTRIVAAGSTALLFVIATLVAPVPALRAQSPAAPSKPAQSIAVGRSDPSAKPDRADLDPAASRSGVRANRTAPVQVQTQGRGQGKPPAAAPLEEFGKGAYDSDTPRLVLPKVIAMVNPRYTADAMRAKIQGSVIIEAVIEAGGTVGETRILQSLDPFLGLDDAALAAARESTFEPATLDGVAVPVIVKLTMEFRLH